MFNGWKITNILDVGLCELDTADGPYNKPVVNDEGVSFDLPGEVGVLLTSRWRGELRDFVAQLVVGNEE